MRIAPNPLEITTHAAAKRKHHGCVSLRSWRAIVLTFSCITGLHARLAAHPFHVTRCELERTSESGRVEISLRLPMEDLELALGAAQLPNRLEEEAQRQKVVTQYLQGKFEFKDAAGKPIPWTWVGSELIRQDLWIYLQTEPVESLETLQLVNRVLVEHNPEQSNLVIVRYPQGKQALECTAETDTVSLALLTDARGQTASAKPNVGTAPATDSSDLTTGGNPKQPGKGSTSAAGLHAQGRVFHDRDGDGKYSPGEPLLPGIRVSNGREIVRTDPAGYYTLPVDDDTALFVLKPRNWRTLVAADGRPRFYYLHKPNGSPKYSAPGVEPTGPLPEWVDFPLYPQDEPTRFDVLLYGDTQPRNEQEMDYLLHDVIEECLDTDARFGVTLGDIVFDDLSVFDSYVRGIGLIGIPWYNVLGNHDMNYEAKVDALSDETFERYFGPSYYSFDYGPTHFVVLDNVEWLMLKGADGKEYGEYRGGLGADQLEFLKQDLAEIPADRPVVLMMHIPLIHVVDRQELYRLLEHRACCLSIAAHEHYHRHVFIDEKDGWKGAVPHHHVINVTACGSWWSGNKDERGIPHTLMRCGAPNGYTTLTFDGNQYSLRYKAAGFSADYQMAIHTPDQMRAAEQTELLVNVFNALPNATVEYRLDETETWLPLTRVDDRMDPAFLRLLSQEQRLANKDWLDLPSPEPSGHLWSSKLPVGLSTGTHLIHVRSTDPINGQVTGHRGIRVVH